jgi:predicted nuclease of predicted toxin-antitoxin system
MSVPLVNDMNLSTEWVTELARYGWTAVHWSTIGEPRAEDSVIMAWALVNRYVDASGFCRDTLAWMERRG